MSESRRKRTENSGGCSYSRLGGAVALLIRQFDERAWRRRSPRPWRRAAAGRVYLVGQASRWRWHLIAQAVSSVIRSPRVACTRRHVSNCRPHARRGRGALALPRPPSGRARSPHTAIFDRFRAHDAVRAGVTAFAAFGTFGLPARSCGDDRARRGLIAGWLILLYETGSRPTISFAARERRFAAVGSHPPAGDDAVSR